MKLRKILALALATIMLLALVACGSSGTSTPSTSGSSSSSSSSEPSSSSSSSSSSTAPATTPADDDEDEDEEEIVDIKIALMALAPVDKDNAKAVVDKMNEMTERDIGVHADIVWYDAANYGTQIPMQIQANEQLDVIMFTPVPGSSYPGYRTANQLLDISGYLQEYGQDILAVNSNLLKGVSYGSAIYGVTHLRDVCSNLLMQIRKDVAEEAGVVDDIINAKSYTDLEKAFLKMTEVSGMPAVINVDAEGTVLYPYPFVSPGDAFTDAYWFDTAGDGYYTIMLDEDTNTVNCVFYTDDYAEQCERVARWYQEGLVYKDATITQEYGDSLIKAGVGYVHVRAGEQGVKESAEANHGYELIQIDITPGKLSTGSCTKFGYCVPVVSKEPAAAVKWINYLYTSSEAMNTITWGVEGRDWVLGDDGLAHFPEGVDQGNVKYHTMEFLYGDAMLITPWEGSEPNIREIQAQNLANAQVSKFMGFSLDTTGLENIITACANVRNQYKPALDSGSSNDWAADLAEFRAALKAAGMDELLAAYQGQLDAWLADNA